MEVVRKDLKGRQLQLLMGTKGDHRHFPI